MPHRFLAFSVTALVVSFGGIAKANPFARSVWDLPALGKAPQVHPAADRPAAGMRSLFYEGADYKTKPAWVFAYYAAPAGDPPAGGWPAVVCAHGGGGTAYPGWVREWNKHGYAALAMDLEGHLPGGKAHGVEDSPPLAAAHPNAGPARIDWFGDRGLPGNEQWFYHAVAGVIRAHSLLRSFPEINPAKIGLTGISWGGTVVSAVAGIDPRFAFVIPVYGCGFIHESDNPGLSQWFPPKNMTAGQFGDYRTKWDPSAHLPHAKMPMLWVTGVADPVFQVNIVSKSAQTAAGPSTLCLRPFLAHGHGNGWEDAPEIYAFADNVVKGGPPLPKFDKPKTTDGGTVRVKYTGDLTEIWVYFTDSGGLWKDRKWKFIQCNVAGGEAVSREPIPKGATAYLVYGFRVGPGGRSNHSATEVDSLVK